MMYGLSSEVLHIFCEDKKCFAEWNEGRFVPNKAERKNATSHPSLFVNLSC